MCQTLKEWGRKKRLRQRQREAFKKKKILEVINYNVVVAPNDDSKTFIYIHPYIHIVNDTVSLRASNAFSMAVVATRSFTESQRFGNTVYSILSFLSRYKDMTISFF